MFSHELQLMMKVVMSNYSCPVTITTLIAHNYILLQYQVLSIYYLSYTSSLEVAWQVLAVTNDHDNARSHKVSAPSPSYFQQNMLFLFFVTIQI